MDCIAHGVENSQTLLSDFHFRAPAQGADVGCKNPMS